ncbi:MAG: hypothetical protein U1E61_08890 [Bradyrhizobium sp.]
MRKTAVGIIVAAGIVSFLIALLLFWGGERLFPLALGANSGANTVNIRTYMGAATAFGIMSKLIYDFLSSSSFYEVLTTSRGQAILSITRSVLLSAILSPIVLYAVYKTLAEIDDSMLAALMCYQNGFFFQTILTSREPK